jgi:hypothetical protein
MAVVGPGTGVWTVTVVVADVPTEHCGELTFADDEDAVEALGQD